MHLFMVSSLLIFRSDEQDLDPQDCGIGVKMRYVCVVCRKENCMKYCIRFISATVLATLVVACEDTTTFDARRTLSQDEQRAAFVECAEGTYVAHWLHLHKLKSRNGLLYVEGSDGSGVLVAEARGLNQCAWSKMDEIIAVR